MPRPSNKLQRRDQIVAGMMQVMSQSGYEGATVAAIARAAGLTPGLVHYHFKSKQAILLELVEQLARRLEARYRDNIRQSTPLGRLHAFLDAHLSTEGADPAVVACWVAIGAEALRQPEVAQVYGRAVERQWKELRGLLEELGAPPDQSAEFAAATVAAIEGCYQLAAAVPQLTPSGFAARSVKAMVAGLLGSSVKPIVPS